jgi:beta-glucosidase
VFGTRPVEAEDGARRLARLQRHLVEQTRIGVPAIVHEECLSGLMTLGATVFPAPLALAATFDPEGVERMTRAIGETMAALGVHQGLAPVLDVVRDYRWGRVEETFGEDPYLVGALGAAYVRGLESAGIVATLKHFAGYSASRAGRNLAPVSIGPRELRDVVLPPFETALREGGARSVMHSYSELDGVPAAADETLLTGVLREEWEFDGVVVADYFGIAFLETQHGVAGSPGAAGALALRAGVDLELPATACYGEALADLVHTGSVPEQLVDRAARRVLRQKGELGLLDADWSPERPPPPQLDAPQQRALARELAERSIVLLSNDGGALPVDERLRSLAVIGPCADDPAVLLGDYAFPNHVVAAAPEAALGIEVRSLAEALRDELPAVRLVHETGCPVSEPDRSGLAAAVAAAGDAELCILAVGDRSGLFGRGTSGEGSDAEDLRLPGVQAELVEAVLDAGTPVVLVVVSGRPYALGSFADRLAAAVQAFAPGEEGGPAIARVLTGRAVPSGKLPVQIPRRPGGQPSTYLHPRLGGASDWISTVDPTPLFAFGHGLSYTTFVYDDLRLSADEVGTDGEVTISCVVANRGGRAGEEVVQLYLTDPVSQVTRPVAQLAGFARVPLEPGGRTRVTFRLHADRTAFTGVDLRRIVEPGELQISVGAASADIRLRGVVRLTGPEREVGHDRVLTTPVDVTPVP